MAALIISCVIRRNRTSHSAMSEFLLLDSPSSPNTARPSTVCSQHLLPARGQRGAKAQAGGKAVRALETLAKATHNPHRVVLTMKLF